MSALDKYKKRHAEHKREEQSRAMHESAGPGSAQSQEATKALKKYRQRFEEKNQKDREQKDRAAMPLRDKEPKSEPESLLQRLAYRTANKVQEIGSRIAGEKRESEPISPFAKATGKVYSRYNEGVLNLDTEKEERDLKKLDADLRIYDNFERAGKREAMDEIDSRYEGGLRNASQKLSIRRENLEKAKVAQYEARNAGLGDPSSKYYDPEFENLSKNNESEADKLYRYINSSAEEKLDQELREQFRDNKLVDTYSEKNYQNMSESEIAIFNYYYEKEGKDEAQQFLDSIQDDLNMRKGEIGAGAVDDNKYLQIMSQVLGGAEVAFDGYTQDLFDYLNSSETVRGTTAAEYRQQAIGRDMHEDGFVWGTVNDFIGSTTNMLPQMVVSMFAGPTAGQATMFGQVSGKAYREAVNRGFDPGQAQLYSTLIGASEIGLQKVLGGITAVGGKAMPEKLTKWITKAGHIENAIGKIAIDYGSRMFSEGLEEGLQEVIEPVISNLILGTDEDINMGDVAYSALLGALTAGVFEAPSTVGNVVATRRTGKEIQKIDGAVDTLKSLRDKVSVDSLAYKLAGKVDENTGAYDIGRLFYEMDGALIEANKQDITRYLTEKKHIDAKSAEKIADALAAVVDGAALSKQQIDMLNSNKDISKAWKEAIIDPNSTVNQRVQGYNEVLRALADEKASREASQNASGRSYEDLLKDDEEIFSRGQDASPEGKYKVSADRATIRNIDGAEVNIREVASAQDGKVTYRLDDGSVVDSKEISLGSKDIIYSALTDMGVDATSANLMMDRYRITGGVSPEVYANGIAEAYRYGQFNYDVTELAKGPFSSMLSYDQASLAHRIGKLDAEKVVAKRTEAVRNKRAIGNTTKGQVHFDGNRETLTERQSASISALETVADALGVQIYVFESEIGENGKRVGANGWYDQKDGSIHIDLHAGVKGEATMLFTAAHELTHFIKQWSPRKFKVLANFLMKEYGQKGVSVETLVQRQIEKAKNYKQHSRELTYEEAYEEVIADSMESMLADGKVIEKLSRLKAQDKSLFDKIKGYITDLVTKIRGVYKGLTPDSREGRFVAEMLDTAEQLQNLFTEGLMEAGENYQATVNHGEEGVVTNANGDPVAFITEEGSVMLSLKTYEEDGREEFRKYLDKCVSSKRLTKTEMQEMLDGIENIYQICKEFKDKYAPFGAWSDAEVIYDEKGKPVFSVVTPNGEYKMNLDFSLVCKKRRTLDAVFNEMAKRGIIDDFELGQKSVVKINEIIRSHGLETACALCFVDAKRFRQAAMADMFVDLYNDLVYSLVPGMERGKIAHFNFSGNQSRADVPGIHEMKDSDLDFTHINEVMKKYGKGTVEYKAAAYIKRSAEARKLLQRGDFMSSEGFDAVKTQNKTIMSLYNSKKGTGGPKAAFGDAQYLNEVIKKARQWTPAKAYSVGGVRIQSFSDYVPRMVFDYVQMVYDLAATKLPAHAYTKEAMFAKQFGLTGIKINMSLIPAIADGGIAPGLDANGGYVWAGESFDFETAKQIQNAEGYTENCGTICVGVSYEHIRKLLSDPDIRMVIPYHKSGLNPIVAHMNKIAAFTDYTSMTTNPGGCQNTVDKDGKKVAKDFDFNDALRSTGDPKAAVRMYFDWCSKNGYTPRFAEFAWHENYYKLIEDFTLYDMNGRYVPQHEVKTVFPADDSAFGSMKSLIESALEEDAIVEGKRDSALGKIVDEIQQSLPRTEAEIPTDQVEQAERDLEADTKYSVREDMTEEERYEELKDRKVVAVENTDYSQNMDILESIDSLPPKAKSSAEKHIYKLAENLGILRKPKSHPEIKFEFQISKNNGLKKSLNNQLNYGGDYGEFARALINLDSIIQNAVLIEAHTADRYKDTIRENERFEGAYVLLGAFQDSEYVFPVKLEIKKETGETGNLYVVVALTKIEKTSVMGSEVPHSNEYDQPLPVTGSVYSLQQIASKINTEDADFLKYLPDAMLSEEQIIAKNKALEADKAKVNRLRSESAIRYQDRPTESVSNRSLLANALERVTQNDIERKRLQEYKDKIDYLNEQEKTLAELNEEIELLSSHGGTKEEIRKLRSEARKSANRISIIDSQLLRLEATAPLQNVLKRERETAYQKAKAESIVLKEEYKRRVAETNAKRQARIMLQREVLKTTSWISRPKKGEIKCPDVLKGVYSEFLRSIDLSSVTLKETGAMTQNDLRLASAMDSLATTVDKVLRNQNPANDGSEDLDIGYLDLPENFVHKLRDVAENIKEGMNSTSGAVNDMSSDEVKTITETIRTLNHAIREMSTLYSNLRFANVEAVGSTTTDFLESLGEIEVSKKGADFIQWDNALPFYAFKRFGAGGESIFEELMDAQDNLAFKSQEIFDFQKKTWNDKEANEWSKDEHEVELTGGNKITLTTSQAMSLYCLSKRAHALQHLLVGGAKIVGLQKGSKQKSDTSTLLTQSDLDLIVKSLTDRQRTIAEGIQEFMSTVCAEWGNEISMKRFLTREFNEKFYFPIEVDGETRNVSDPTAQQSDLYRLLNISATKELVPNANSRVVVRNIFEVFAGHSADMARLNSYGMALLDYMKWLNYRETDVNKAGQKTVRGVRDAMRRSYGKAATSYVLNLIKDVNGRPSDGGDPTLLMKWMRNAKTASVGSSLRTATLQITSYPRAAAVLSVRSLALGLTRLPKIVPKIKLAQKYCGIALWKSFGFYDTNIGRTIEEQFKGTKNPKQKMIELSLKGAELGDAVTWGALWCACEYEVARTKKYDVGSEAFKEAVGKKLREVVYKTQVVDSTLTRSQMMRSKSGMTQEAAAFMSEPTLSMNMLMDAKFEFQTEKRKNGAKAAMAKKSKYVGRALAVYSIGQLSAALLESFWDAWRDDDDEEFSDKFFDALKQNALLDLAPFNKVPIISDLFEWALASAGIGYFSSDKMSTSWLSQGKDAIDAWKDYLDGKGVTPYGATYKTLRALSSFSGVPVAGVMREGVDLWNNTAGAADEERKILKYDRNMEQRVNLIIKAYKEGDKVLAKKRFKTLLEETARKKTGKATYSDKDKSEAKSTIKSAVGSLYKDGVYSKALTEDILKQYFELEEDEIYWTLEKWDNAANEDYAKMGEFWNAVENGDSAALRKVIKHYTEHGVEEKTIKQSITTHFKPIYLELKGSEKSDMRKKLVSAFAVLGDNPTDAGEKIDRWKEKEEDEK